MRANGWFSEAAVVIKLVRFISVTLSNNKFST